jgi:ABC-type nickel/cobalt efflux system permease component RcnA
MNQWAVLSPLVLILTAFTFGAVHAVTPGHGKSVVASYFFGQNGTPRRGLIISAKVIATHVLSSVVLVLAATFLVDVSFGAKPVTGSRACRRSCSSKAAPAWSGRPARCLS